MKIGGGAATATTTLSANNFSSYQNSFQAFSADHLAQMFQIIADIYLPCTTIGEELISQAKIETQGPEVPLENIRAVALLKKIELSKGYDNYRKNRQMLGISKPPVIISKANTREMSRNLTGSMVGNDFSPSRFTNGAFATNKSKELSCFKTMSAITPFRTVSMFQSTSRIVMSSNS